MGTGALSSSLSTAFFKQPLSFESPNLFGSKSEPSTAALFNAAPEALANSNLLTSDPALSLDDEFNSVVYRSQVDKVSLSLAYKEAMARASNAEGDGAVSASAKQLTFQFYAESRVEELARFSSRTAAVANGLEENQRATYTEASRLVAQRFSFSMTISGAALEGFSGASQQLQEADDAGGINELLKLTNDALGKSDDILDKIFQLLGDFFSSTEDDFQTRFQKLYEGMQNLGLAGSPTQGAGTTFSASRFSIQLEFSFESVEIEQVQQSDPIVLDLDDDGIELTSYKNGAQFDIRGDGRTVKSAFVTGGDAFLAIDRNGNGRIDNGRELFGDQNGARNGFEELRKLDSNSDGFIDANDKAFDKLLLFRDNGNGKTEAGELLTLAQAGIKQIDLRYQDVNETTSGGNKLAQRAGYTYEDGRRGKAADALLNFTA